MRSRLIKSRAMTFQSALLLFLVALAVCTSDGAIPTSGVDYRSRFPSDFLFGVGSAAYQYEGAATTHGKGPSVWDTFVQNQPEKISKRTPGPPLEKYPGEIAVDFLNRYKEDVKLLKTIGVNSFRFSISWSRIFPNGNIHRGINPLGVLFYNNLINELKANGIEPLVTLLHFDPPQALEDAYGGFRSTMIVGDFRDYADFCFKTFGDRVKYWTTLNEPSGFNEYGYDAGRAAPGRCSNYSGSCPFGDSATEPYIAAHHMLLSHAAAVNLYRQNYKPKQGGEIGITVVSRWYVPKYDTPECYDAADRAFDFSFGWFANPITYGEYPEVMRKIVGSRLPHFTVEESKLLKGSYDFLGVNYYTAVYVENDPPPVGSQPSYHNDMQVKTSGEKRGVPLGKKTDLGWLQMCPQEFREYLHHIKNKYNDPTIYVTENGSGDKGSLTVKNGLNDTLRIEYLNIHLKSLSEAITEGVKVKAYYIWTLLDDFEWASGYTSRFGLIYIDFQNDLSRHPKDSSFWYKNFISNNFTDIKTKKNYVCAEHDAIIPQNSLLGGDDISQFYRAA